MKEDAVLPEDLVAGLLIRLKRHGLWDSILIFFSPLLAFFYFGFFLLYSGLITTEALIFSVAAGLGVALALIFHYGRTAASTFSAARLIDDRVDGKDRFVTLATINPSASPSFLIDRLRDEAKRLLHRVNLESDFPYRLKRRFLFSLAGSLSVVILFHLLLQTALFSSPHDPSVEELAVLAQQLSQVPRFSQLARGLNELAVRIRQQDLSSTDRASLIRELLRRIEDQLVRERGAGEGRGASLSQAATALRGLEERVEKGEGQGGGGLRTSLPNEREDRGKELSIGEEGEGRGELAAWVIRKLRGESAHDQTKGAGREKGASELGGRGGLRDKEKGRDKEGMAQWEGEGRGGKSEKKVPRGKVPERFLQPGEAGEKGIKGARFVIVELPEGVAPSSPSGIAEGSKRPFRPKVPVGNIPLPRSTGPDAPPEKQHVPLEYRGLIR
ncbi:MAG: hypothetical protein ACE5JU_06415 [Candidatus Binatia bacterium]